MSNCKVIALTNQKGGVGKTTTAVNLGVGLAKQGSKVLLIDADAQANLTMALGYNRPDDIPITLSTVMQNIIDDKTLDASQGIIHHREGVDLLPSNIELSGFEVRLINAMSRERVLKTYVNEVKKNYDYVLIDCMPSLGMITINALAAADSVIIPTQPHYLSAKGLELLLRSVSMVKRQINPKLRIDGKVKGTSNVYCTAEHDSLKISNDKWYWWSRGFGGYSALDYLIKVKEYDFVEAVEILTGQTMADWKPPPAPKKDEPKVLLLPPQNKDCNRVIQYLLDS